MAGDGTSRINTEELLRAVQEITSIKKSIAANTDATYAIFRKLQDSYAGESADDIYAVAGQLRKSSGAIIISWEIMKESLRNWLVYTRIQKKL